MTERRAVVVVAEAGDSLEAAIWIDALQAAGIEARTFERGVGAALGGAATVGFARYPLVVSREDLAQARSIIAEMGGAGSLSPIEEPGDRQQAQRRGLAMAGLIIGSVVFIALLARLFGS